MKTDKQYVPIVILFLFIAVNVYVAALNWGVFSTVLNIELGFGAVKMPPFIALFIFNLLLILAFWFFEYRKDLKRHIGSMGDRSEIELLKKDLEIRSLKIMADNKNQRSSEASGIAVKKIPLG